MKTTTIILLRVTLDIVTNELYINYAREHLIKHIQR